MRYLIALLIAFGALAAPAPIYVSTAGNDDNPGTFASPYRTIKRGFDMLQSGGTLYLRGGVYIEPGVTINPAISGSGNEDRTTISSYPNERAIFRPNKSNADGLSTQIGTLVSNITLADWTIDFQLKDLAISGAGAYYNLRLRWATNITLTNMHLLNNTNGSLTVIRPAAGNAAGYGPGGNVRVVGCLFSNVFNAAGFSAPSHGMYWDTLHNVVIENNTFANGHSYGIHLWLTDGTSADRGENWVIRQNYFTNFSNGIWLQGNNSFIYNNVLVNIKNNGLGMGSAYTLYANNTIWSSSGQYGLYASGWGDRFVNNIVWGTWSTGLMTRSGNESRPSYWTNNLALTANLDHGIATLGTGEHMNYYGSSYWDPDFLNAPHDLRFAADSPARDSGYNLTSIFTTDYNANARPSTGRWSLGAYIYGSEPGGSGVPVGGDLPAVSVVQDGAAYESGPAASTFTISRTGGTTESLAVPFTVGGTAVAGTHYVALTPPATIGVGDSSATVTVTPIDATSEDIRTVSLTISASEDYTLWQAGSATMDIIGSAEPAAPFVSVTATGLAYETGQQTATFTIRRSVANGDLSVPFAMTGTAVSNVNYTLSGASPATIATGTTEIVLTLTPENLGSVGVDTAIMTLQADAAYTLSVPEATIEIIGSGITGTGFRPPSNRATGARRR